MAANARTTFELKANAEEKGDESSIPTPKRRLEKLAREVFEGHEEYLGLTPDY
jgi:hypothetical protein